MEMRRALETADGERRARYSQTGTCSCASDDHGARRSSSSTRSSRRTSRSSRRRTTRSSIDRALALARGAQAHQLMSSDKTWGMKLARRQGRAARSPATTPTSARCTRSSTPSYDGAPLAIGFNAKYFVELLGEMEGDEVKLELNGELDPGWCVRPTAGERLSRRRHADADLSCPLCASCASHALEARQFRNLEQVLLEPHPRFNVFVGDNGQGKTNLLEAIYLVGTLRSFRAAQARGAGALRRGAGASAGARGEARRRRRGCYEVDAVARARKRARSTARRARADATTSAASTSSCSRPRTCGCRRGAPADRRRFLDRAVFNAQPVPRRGRRPTRRCCARATRCCATAAARGAGDDCSRSTTSSSRAAAVAIVARRRALVDALRPRVAGGVRARSRRPASALGVATQRRSRPTRDRASSCATAHRAIGARDLARGATSSGPHATTSRSMLDGQRGARSTRRRASCARIMLALEDRRDRVLARALGDLADAAARRRLVRARPDAQRVPVRASRRRCRARLHHDHPSRAMSCCAENVSIFDRKWPDVA